MNHCIFLDMRKGISSTEKYSRRSAKRVSKLFATLENLFCSVRHQCINIYLLILYGLWKQEIDLF